MAIWYLHIQFFAGMLAKRALCTPSHHMTVRAWPESMEQAAQRAAKDVLKEFSAQQPDAAELRQAVTTTLDAVRQLEAATMERISSLASSIGAAAPGGCASRTISMQTVSAPPTSCHMRTSRICLIVSQRGCY
jgi:hypothetical protein